jgi:hypothetical protein
MTGRLCIGDSFDEEFRQFSDTVNEFIGFEGRRPCPNYQRTTVDAMQLAAEIV